MRRFGMAGLLGLAMLVGCAAGQKGTAVVTYEKERPPLLLEATADGEYALYNTMAGDPIGTYLLQQGDALGFKPSTQPGMIAAIAGQREIPVQSDKGYVWKRR